MIQFVLSPALTNVKKKASTKKKPSKIHAKDIGIPQPAGTTAAVLLCRVSRVNYARRENKLPG